MEVIVTFILSTSMNPNGFKWQIQQYSTLLSLKLDCLLYLLQDVQHSDIYSVVSSDFGCAVRASSLCTYVCVFFKQSSITIAPFHPQGYIPRPPVDA